MPFFVGCGERIRNRADNFHDPFDGKAVGGDQAIERLPFNQLHRQKVDTLGFFRGEYGDDVRMVECRARARPSRPNRAKRSGSSARLGGRTLRATSRPSFVSVAGHTSPIPPAPLAAVIR